MVSWQTPQRRSSFSLDPTKQGARHLGDLTINWSQSPVFWGSILQGLLNVPWLGYIGHHLKKSPSSRPLIPIMESNGWVMWNMGTWLMTHVYSPKSDVCQLVPFYGAVKQVYLLQTRQWVLGFHGNCHDFSEKKTIGIFGSSPPFKWWFVHMLNYMSMRISRPGSILYIYIPFVCHSIPIISFENGSTMQLCNQRKFSHQTSELWTIVKSLHSMAGMQYKCTKRGQQAVRHEIISRSL